jgi:3-phosphoshikimate 1-carboxyvinyltransferase
MGAASLAEAGSLVLTGDDQVRRRPVGPLAGALADLGVGVRCLASQGCAPVEIVGGGFRGGTAAVDCPTSQYLSSLLLACPLARGDTEIRVTRLNEEPYVRMTLDWLDAQGIVYEARGLRWFRVPGGQRYRAFERRIPADFSSASFFLAAGALLGNRIVCEGLDLEDTQGDKAVIDYLSAMGAAVSTTDQGIEVSGRGLRGVELDLNETPDALPIMAALACFAEGRTVLRNVAHARLKETDRIAVMALELGKLGARIEELEDGLVIEGGPLRAAPLDGHGDHRVVMALAVAASAIPGACVIHSAEAVDVTFPTFPELFRALGGRLIPG